MTPYPKSFSHIGLSVPDLDAAVKFYSETLGFYLIMPSTEITEDDSDIGRMCTDVFGEGWGSLRIAHMSTSDRIGIEIFEFKSNRAPADKLDYRTTSLFHFCIQDPDVEGLTKKIVAAGGKQRMPVREYFPDEKPYRMVYVEDPFGIVFEIYSHGYELTYSAGAYEH
ncbi:lactoylglutathione lyase family protein [uncultured Roseibium sp.]|uniref:lactoylglutathione lyase family protein n=1 Tax=uncultured Roseibium sp. TaxID=1936171 RepID=UPI0025913F63|nr:lactoylglutathione lyase family protein [uncultured Roseibium sp.]